MNVSLSEAAQLEAVGCRARLDAAIRANRNFIDTYGEVLDGNFVFHAGIAPELLGSLQRELTALAVELDVAYRALRHAETNLQVNQ